MNTLPRENESYKILVLYQQLAFLFFKLSLDYYENRNLTIMPFAMCFLTSIILWIL